MKWIAGLLGTMLATAGLASRGCTFVGGCTSRCENAPASAASRPEAFRNEAVRLPAARYPCGPLFFKNAPASPSLDLTRRCGAM